MTSKTLVLALVLLAQVTPPALAQSGSVPGLGPGGSGANDTRGGRSHRSRRHPSTGQPAGNRPAE